MNFKALSREAFVSLRRNWLRSVLTILGISVGVGAFICVVAIGNAGSSKIEDELQSLGDNFVWIEAGSRARKGLRAGARGTRSLVLNGPCHRRTSAVDQEHVSQRGWAYSSRLRERELGHPIQRGFAGIYADSQVAPALGHVLYNSRCGRRRSSLRARYRQYKHATSLFHNAATVPTATATSASVRYWCWRKGEINRAPTVAPNCIKGTVCYTMLPM
jgi:hypothetical protein